MKKKLVISNAIALLVTIVVNYASNTGMLNGNTMKTVSDKYHNFFTPAGYAFSIWGLIYILLIVFVFAGISSLVKKDNNPIFEQISWWFVLTCLANCLWVFAWLYDYTGLSVILMIILLTSLVKIIFNARLELDHVPFKRIVSVWWPFCFYAGWISVALIADIAAYLTKIEWSGFGISPITWTIIMMCIAGIINLIIIQKRNMREFALVGAWALIAIAVANWTASKSIAYTGLVIAVILIINTMIHGFRNRKYFIESFKL
ncbi:tryptophan-rich sensory protein [Arachidicoccus soli]|uniref:Tryptophan-rich sensory protein n=1 Tax=Arachidicoccus soli TaxID=2341117 RepID=A0A386HQH1_9BACT|nr:tryptophan-rich sensory protein [Arachidicoccus soli]AYD47826.1 tryptophan-rich sensory protein [Arachidicoccus soli]